MAKLITLESGLKLFFQRHASSKAFALGVFVGAGCVYENPANNGIAHFIEHMVFKGTEKRSSFDIADETDKCGIMLNAFTTRQYTAFYTIGLAEYANKCADILSDLYFNATFTEENMAKEKGVVIEEIKMYEDDSEDLCLENLVKAHYGKKMISAPILGTEKNVKKFDYQTIKDFMKEYYRPENTCIAVVGNVTEKFAVELVDKYFKFVKNDSPFLLPKVKTAKPRAKYVEKIKPIEQSAVGISFPSFSYKSKKRNVPAFIASILGGGGMSSRLFQEVREKAGLVYEIYAGNNQYINNAYFTVFFGTSPNQVCEAMTKVKECLVEALDKGFTQEEYDKAMAQLKTGLALGSESASEIMRLGGRYGLLGKKYTHNAALKALEKVTLDDINEGLREMLDFNKASVSYVGQKIDCDLFKLLRGEE